jgi:hypothetical protein
MAVRVDSREQPRWLLLMFSLPAKRASERVEIWRKLRRIGALALPSSGYLLPSTPGNQEHFEWLAAAISKYKGQASVVRVHSIDELPDEDLIRQFTETRNRDYQHLLTELRATRSWIKKRPQLARIRKRFQEIRSIDFFQSPLRSRIEELLSRVDATQTNPAKRISASKKSQYQGRIWLTRPQPGIDRVSSAWLIQRFIDAQAKFAFGDSPALFKNAIPFDMFHADGFGHRGEDCTFETLRKEFAIRDPKVATIAEIIHDADLADEKFGRTEGAALDHVLIGWAQQGVPDAELLERGMQLIEGLYRSMAE